MTVDGIAAPRAPNAAADLDHEDAVALLACQTEVLEQMSTGSRLPVLLDCITSGLEALMPASMCSLLLLDETTGSLRHGSAPSLPRAYLDAIDGLVPGPDEGSCGSAAYLGEAVVATDVRVDPRWRDYRAAAASAGLVACWSTPVVGASGRVVGTFAVYHRDVHQPTLREQLVVDRLTYLASVVIDHEAMFGALAVSEERFRRAFEDTAVAMALLDTDGRVTRTNKAMLRILGHDAETVRGIRVADLVVGDERDRFQTVLQRVAPGGRSIHCEATLAREAQPVVVSMTMSLVRGPKGEPVQISVTMVDITERQAAQRERQARLEAELAQRTAEAASRAKSQFLSAVSHEMRTPLQAMTGFAELLGTLDLDAERRREALRHITTGANHLLALVDDTLDLARIEADALPLTMEPIRVSEALVDVLDFLRPVAESHRVTLVVQDAVGHVLADRRRLRQVLINLISNGIRYGGHLGVVRVGSHPVPGHPSRACVYVADNGPGIDPAVRERLFEPFVPGDRVAVASSSEPGSGSIGLGLMLARGLSEAMGGRLTLGSAPGGGTLAQVVLATDEHSP